MSLNVSMNYAYSYENKDSLQNSAKNILTSKGASEQNAQKIIEKAFVNTSTYDSIFNNAQLSVIKASTQISLNNSLNETLKYLKSHANKFSKKQNVFGEIWQVFNVTNDASEKNPYEGELCNFEINTSAKNIFAA